MSLSGDLSTLELADLLQNLESHERSGVLTIEGDEDAAHLYFQRGRLALIHREGRPSLVEVLVASGTIDEETLESARRKRRRTKRSLGEVLVAMRALTAEELEGVAASRLLDEACELVASKRGAFTFTAGPVPRGVFDPEERRLELALAAGPLLLESARREDHWRMIRERVPSDGAHFVAQGRPRKVTNEQAELAEELLPMLDGASSVSEVVAAFPHRRFEVYQLLADLVEEHAIRAAGVDEWARLVEDARRGDPDRAARLLQRALASNPLHVELLALQVLVAEETGELERAVESLKMVVHLALEGGDRERAKRELEHGRELAPEDPALLERAVDLALEEGRTEDAARDGLLLVELWRRPGLHARAVALLERLTAARPDDLVLLRELAQSRADCGDLEKGVAPLLAHGEALLSRRQDGEARAAFEAVLALDPRNVGARTHVEAIDTGALERRRDRRRARWRRVRLTALLVAAGTALVYDTVARVALTSATSAVAQERLVEDGRYDEAAQRFADVRRRFPLAPTAWWDVRLRLADLARKGGHPGTGR